MKIITHNITLDVASPHARGRMFEVKRKDGGTHTIIFTLTENGTAISEYDGITSYRVRILHMDKSSTETEYTDFAGTIKHTLSAADLGVFGDALCEVSLYDDSGSRLTSAAFGFFIVPDINTDEGVLNDSNYPVLDNLIKTVNENLSGVESMTKKANDLITKAETVGSNASNLEEALQTINNNVNAKANEVKSNSDRAETAADSANSAMSRAETAANSSKTEASKAQSAKNNAVTAQQAAELAQGKAETAADNAIAAKTAAEAAKEYAEQYYNNIQAYTYSKDDANLLLDNKVDKVEGKGLSTNDYTDTDKAEVAKIKDKVDKVTGKGLSTNDYTDTEKAEVAKVEKVNTSINNLEAEIFDYIYNKNLCDKSTMTVDSFVNFNTGELGANTSYVASDYIQVEKGVFYGICGTFTHFAFYDNEKQFVKTTETNDLTTLESGGKGTIYVGSNPAVWFISPIDGYIRFSCYTSIFNSSNSKPLLMIIRTSDDIINTTYPDYIDSIYKENVLKKGIDELNNDVDNIDANLNKVLPIADVYEQTEGNLIDKAIEKVEGKYTNISNGIVVLIANSAYDCYLIPTKNKKYIYSGSNTSSSLRFAVPVAEDKKTALVDTQFSVVKSIDNTEIKAPYWYITLSHASTTNSLFAENEPPYTLNKLSGKWSIEEMVTSDNIIHTYLPSEICVAVGCTIELYNNLVCLEADKYHLDWVCDVGTDYKRKWSVTGITDKIGEYPLALNIYDDNLNIVKTLSTTVKIVENSMPDSVNILPIGDSLTNNKPWLNEVISLSSSKVSFIGTRGTSTLSYKHEGRSGASAKWYNGDNTYTFDTNYVGSSDIDGSKNPFWDSTNNRFSLKYYIDTQGSTIGVPDAIQLLLGTNGLNIDPTDNVNNIKSIVDNIRLDYSDIPIFVCNTIYRSNQNGYYSTGSDGYTTAINDFEYNNDMKIMKLQQKIAETFSEYTNVYIVPLSVCMDREYNFGQKEVSVNPRLTNVTIKIPIESVHPQTAGYMQMADVMYSSYSAHLKA